MTKKSIFFVIVLILFGFSFVTAQDTARMQQIAQEMEQVQADFIAGKINPQQLQQRLTELNRQLEEARRSMASTGASFSQAQLQRIETLLDQDKRLLAQYNESRISEASYTQQATAVRNELNQINAPFAGSNVTAQQYADVEEKVNRLWPGASPGLPSDNIFQERKTPRFTIPEDLRVSWSDRRRGLFTLYITKCDQRTLDHIRMQINTQTGRTMELVNDYGGGNLEAYILDIPDVLYTDEPYPEWSVRLVLRISNNRVIYEVGAGNHRGIHTGR